MTNEHGIPWKKYLLDYYFNAIYFHYFEMPNNRYETQLEVHP